MSVLHSALSGIVQGLTEFLPISSSGHLVILPWIFGLQTHPLAFDIILHLGTFFAIVIYFRKEWVRILREGFLSIRQKNLGGSVERKLFWCIVVASLPIVILGSIIGKGVEEYFRNPILAAVMLGVFGILLYISELYGRKNKFLKEITLKAALIIGLFQMFAIMPGVSRSGVTISAALVLGMNRESSVRFSFLIAAPVIFAAACYSIINTGISGGSLAWPALLAGFTLSFLSSMIAIHFLLKFIRAHSFVPFTIYRLVLSLFIIIVFLAR